MFFLKTDFGFADGNLCQTNAVAVKLSPDALFSVRVCLHNKKHQTAPLQVLSCKPYCYFLKLILELVTVITLKIYNNTPVLI